MFSVRSHTDKLHFMIAKDIARKDLVLKFQDIISIFRSN